MQNTKNKAQQPLEMSVGGRFGCENKGMMTTHQAGN